MTRENKMQFCLEGAMEFEGLDSEELAKYKEELQKLSNEELDKDVERWDYLWTK